MGFNFGEILAGLIQPIFGGLSILDQNTQQNQYTADIDQLMADMTGIASQYGPETLGAYDASAGQQLGTFQDMQRTGNQGSRDLYRNTEANRGRFLSDIDARGQNLMQGFRDRYNTAERDIEGYGEQMQADINRGAEENRARFALNPLSRGSTISSSVNRNIEEGRTAEQRRLGEDLTRQRVNLLSGLSGDTLNAQGGLDAAYGLYDSALSGQVLDTQRYGQERNLNAMGNIGNFYGQNAANRSGIVGNGYNTMLNTLGSFNLMPPQQNQLPFQIGSNMVQPYQPQTNPFEAFLGGAAPRIGAGAGQMFGGMGGGFGGFGGGGGGLTQGGNMPDFGGSMFGPR